MSSSSSPDTVFVSVGRALNHWERFEARLAMTFAGLIGATSDDGFAAMRAYGSIVSFQARTNAIKAAAEVFFAAHPNTEALGKLRELLNDAQKLSAHRNNIAHGVIELVVQMDREDVKQSEYCLTSAYHATRRRNLIDEELEPYMTKEQARALQLTSASYAYSAQEIECFAAEFGKLCSRAIEISSHIGSLRMHSVNHRDRSSSDRQ